MFLVESNSIGDTVGSYLLLIPYTFKAIVFTCLRLLRSFIAEISATEQLFLLMNGLYTFMCQFFFFTLCDIVILKPENRPKSGKVISSLTTLLLYSIVTYFATRVRNTFRYSIESTNSLNSRDNILKILRVVLEFVKAVVVIICLREQGLHYEFDHVYTTITFLYFLCTERLFVNGIVLIVQVFQFSALDTLEHLYVPIALHAFTISLTVCVISYLFFTGKYVIYGVLSSYFTLYLPTKNMVLNYVNPLRLEQQTFASFKIANETDLNQWDDICAVCLERMSRARITPCKHLFHPQCLKRCLQTSMQCPLCKNDFTPNQDI